MGSPVIKHERVGGVSLGRVVGGRREGELVGTHYMHRRSAQKSSKQNFGKRKSRKFFLLIVVTNEGKILGQKTTKDFQCTIRPFIFPA